MSIASPKRRRRSSKAVDITRLPPIESLDPAKLKQFSKEELTAYLASKGIRAKFTKPEMKRQVRLLIQAVRDNNPDIIKKLQDDGLRELVEIPSRKSSRRLTAAESSGVAANTGMCVGEGCKKKCNRECEFQRCRSCCTAGGFLCYTHVSDFTRIRSKSGKLSRARDGGKPAPSVGASSLVLSVARPVVPPASATPHHLTNNYHLRVQDLRQLERARSRSTERAFHKPPLSASSSLPLPSFAGVPASTTTTTSATTSATTTNPQPLHSFPPRPTAHQPESRSITPPVDVARAKRRSSLAMSDSLPAERECPSCGILVSNVGSNFLAHLRTCEMSLSDDEFYHRRPNSSEFSSRLHANSEMIENVFGVDTLDDVMCKLGNTSISEVEKDIVAARTALSEFSDNSGRLDGELEFWKTDTFHNEYENLQSPLEFDSEFPIDLSLDRHGSGEALDDIFVFPPPMAPQNTAPHSSPSMFNVLS